MNKLAYLKSTRQNLRESVSYVNNIGQATFEDSNRAAAAKGHTEGESYLDFND